MQFGKGRGRWADNIEMDLTEKGWEGVGWIHMKQDTGQVIGCCEYGDKPDGSIRC